MNTIITKNGDITSNYNMPVTDEFVGYLLFGSTIAIFLFYLMSQTSSLAMPIELPGIGLGNETSFISSDLVESTSSSTSSFLNPLAEEALDRLTEVMAEEMVSAASFVTATGITSLEIDQITFLQMLQSMDTIRQSLPLYYEAILGLPDIGGLSPGLFLGKFILALNKGGVSPLSLFSFGRDFTILFNSLPPKGVQAGIIYHFIKLLWVLYLGSLK